MYETKGNTARAYVARSIDYAPQRSGASQLQHLHKSFWNYLSLVGCLVVGFAAVWMIANSGASIYTLNYQNIELQSKIQTLSATNASLTAKVDELERPARILGLALGSYHEQYANPIRIGSSK